MLIGERTRRLDAFKRRYVFRSARTGRYVPRWYALLFPSETVREKVANKP